MDWIEAELLDVVDETPLDRSLLLGLDGAQRLAFGAHAGQHVLLEIVGTTPSPRGAYSISALPVGADPLQVTVRGEGDLGRLFYGLEPGARLRVSPPRGRFRLAPDGARALVLFGRGPSVAPYRALVRSLSAEAVVTPVTLVHESTTEELLLFGEEFARHDGERGWFTWVPRVATPVDAALMATLVETPATTRICVCGENEFVDRVRGLARDRGVPDENVLREKWG